MLQGAQLKDIGAQRKQSTPTDVADAETGQNALATPRVSNQRSAGASDRYDSAHRGEWDRHSGPRPGRAEMPYGANIRTSPYGANIRTNRIILISRILRMTCSGNHHVIQSFHLLAIYLVTGLAAIKFCLAGLIEKLGDERLWLQDLDPTVP